MKYFAILIMLAALFLLYRIACPKQADKNRGGDASPEKPKPAADVMGKSRFVLPDRSQPLPTPATSLKADKQEEKAPIFAAETGLDEVFADEPDPESLSIPPDETDDDEVDYEAEEEAEDLSKTLGREAVMADGVDYDRLQAAVKVVKEQPGEVSEETAGTIAELEKTDMFEMLVSGDGGKADWIKAIVERHIRKATPATENEVSGTDYGDFDVVDYLD